MTDIYDNARRCPHCGELNSADRAVCTNCQSPMTAYAGDITGEPGEHSQKHAEEIAFLTTRPPASVVMAAFDVFFAVFWPLAYVIGSFLTRPQMNSEGTNYINAAVGTVQPILAAIFLLPMAGALCAVAWATWNQRTWAWMGNAVALGLFAVMAVPNFRSAPLSAVFWLAVAGGLAYLWFQKRTKDWYGQA